MNVLENVREKKLKEMLHELTLTPANEAMAVAYLQNESRQDDLLAQAQPEDLLQKTMEQRWVVSKCLDIFRKSGDLDILDRFYRLFWAIGKESAVFLLYEPFGTLSPEKREWRVDVLGKPAVAAMEAARLVWMWYQMEDVEAHWLHGLAQREAALLEEAQTVCEPSREQTSMMLAGILLCHTGDQALVARQKEILRQGIRTCVTQRLQMFPVDRKALLAYMEQGDPTQPVPCVTYSCAQSGYLRMGTDAFFLSLAGMAAFLIQDACALRVCASLNPLAVLRRITGSVPGELILERLDLLVEALPEKAVDLLLFLVDHRYPVNEGLAKTIADKCVHALPHAVERADDHQYGALSRLFPHEADTLAKGLQKRIIDRMVKGCCAGGDDLEAYLWETGSLKNTETELEHVETASLYLGGILMDYLKNNGWDNFACRCAAALGINLKWNSIYSMIFGVRVIEEKDLREMVQAMLDWELPVKSVMEVLGGVLSTSNYEESSGIVVVVRNVAAQMLGKAEYLEELRKAAVKGNVHARSMAIDALRTLQDREGLLACAGDHAKQIKEQLLAAFTEFPQWAADYEALLKHKKAPQRMLAAQALGKLGITAPLEGALSTEKNMKVSQAIADAMGQAAVPTTGQTSLVVEMLKGNKARKLQWLLEKPLPELALVDGTPVSPDHRAAILAAYGELSRSGRGATVAELTRDMRPADLEALAHEVFELWMAAGAQSKTKWVLDFAAVHGGSAMVAKLLRAIHDWPQHARGAIACEAVHALVLNPDPAALLAVDAISRKFKFRQVKTAAGQAMENAAQALGITSEELADRIVPDLGFGADGKRVFDYGNRQFVVRLTPTLELEITNQQGKKVKNLPAPGKNDDAERAETAYQSFKTMKKQMRTTVSAQKTRLDVALSGLRCWDAQAWEKLFVKNPVMHQFAIGLVWGVYQDGVLGDTFRYMEDGSFNTVEEEEYDLPEQASIGLVHPVELDQETLANWKQQLEDYEITQPIAQLERPVYRMTPEEEGACALERFGGKKLHSLSLAGKLMASGWNRGSVQDGGMYTTFYREDPVLGLAVELNFSGSFVSYEEESVTVYDAVFYKAGTVAHGSYVYDTPKAENVFALSQIPARYFSEVIYQLDRATASSTDCDPDWKQKKG